MTKAGQTVAATLSGLTVLAVVLSALAWTLLLPTVGPLYFLGFLA
jgi:hypothetical protein